MGWFPGSGSRRGVAGEVTQVMGRSRHPASRGGTSPSPGSCGSSTCRTPAVTDANPQHKSALLPARPAGLVDAKQCTVAPKGSLVLSGLMSLTLQGREERGKVCRLIISNHRPEGHMLKAVQRPGCKGPKGMPGCLLAYKLSFG